MARRRSYQNNDLSLESVLQGLVIFFVLSMAIFWFYDRIKFWKYLAYGIYFLIGLFIVILFLTYLRHIKASAKKKQRDILLKKLNEDKQINTLVLKFIDGFGHEKVTFKNKKNLFIFRDYAFEWNRIREFYDELNRDFFNVTVSDFTSVLRQFLNEKERRFLHERISSADMHSFSELQANGTDFERLIFRLGEAMGYACKHIGKTGDQGADVIASKDGEQVIIQAKCYSWPVGNKAIQEAVAAVKFYGCNKASVITTSTFTPEAVALARANGVELVDRRKLQEFLLTNLHESWR